MLNFVLEKLEKSNLFITGGGGVGKSYITKDIINAYKGAKKPVVVLGSTGISAVEIGGVTLHSFFKLGICKNADELKQLDKKQKDKISELKKILKTAKLIIIDEISMISAEVFDLVYYRLINSEFSGKMLVVGDFYQLPPVQKKDDMQKPQNSLFSGFYAFSSYGWAQLNFSYIEMIGSKRTQDENLYKMLSNLRVGVVNDDMIEFLKSRLVDFGGANLDSTMIFGRNKEADELNALRLNAIDSPLVIAKGYYEIYDFALSDEKIAKWIKSLSVNENLHLKVGAKVIFTTNKWGEFYNGEQGIIEEFREKNGIVESIVITKLDGKMVEIERQSYDLGEFMRIDDEIKEIVLASYYQFPIKLAYAITIHKSQGMSIKNLVCDINNIFANGQLYVALSRAVSQENLGIIYSRGRNLKDYIQSVVKIDDEIRNFYQNESFIYIENQKIE